MSIFTDRPAPENDSLLARVLLWPDASVHIATEDRRTVCATPEGLSLLFSSPYDFLDECAMYDETSREINPDGVALREITGLEMACVWKDKRIQIDFPEILQYVFRVRTDNKRWTKPMNMSDLLDVREFSDAKSYMLRLYLDIANHSHSIPVIKHEIKIEDIDQLKIMQAITRTLLDDTLPKVHATREISDYIEKAEEAQAEDKYLPPDLDSEYVTMRQYCDLHNIDYHRTYCIKEDFPSAWQAQNKRWYLKRDDIPRGGMQVLQALRVKEQGKKESKKPPLKISAGSQADIKERVIREGRFAPEIGDFIRSMSELDFYMDNGYKNVFINGRLALIIDIKPDQIIKSMGQTNREIIYAGNSPVVPDSADCPGTGVLELHHVGQRTNSPFAIIPESIHGSALYSALHPGTSDKDLHGKSFEMDKKSFWASYLDTYDAVGFDGFPSAL